MKRQATKYLALTISAIMAVSLTACGDGSDSSADAALTPVEAEPILSDLELEILNLETKYNKGEFEQADYLALADAYHRAGYIRKQRDILEQDYRLYNDTDAFAALQELSVNLEEETDSIRERAQEMQHDLELPEYLDESVNLIDSEDWFLTMMPKLKEGQRNYYLEQDSEPLLYVQVGYTEEGQCFSKVWYTGSQADRFLIQEGATIRMVTVTPAGTAEDTTAPESGTEEGAGTDAATATESLAADIQDTAAPTADAPANTEAWNGSFEAWTMDCADGNIIHEQGTLQNGVLTGEYTCDVCNGDGPLEAYSLWSSREEREYITYTGTFDAEGKILTEQPSEDAKKKLLEGTEYIDLILYAYDAAGENCLWQGIGAGKTAEDYCFGQEMIGLEIRPEYTGYEVVADMTDTTTNGADSADNTDNAADGTTGDTAGSDPKIRIYDGEVQWFDGTYWVSAGSVRDMAKQDPFAAYEENMLPVQRAVPAVSQAVPTAMRPMRMTDRISPAIQALRETRPVAAFRNLRLPRQRPQSLPQNRLRLRPSLLRSLRQPQSLLRLLHRHRRRMITTMIMTTITITIITIITIIAITTATMTTIAETAETTVAIPVETMWTWNGHRI